MTLLHFTFVISLPNCNQKLKLCQCTAGVPELFTSKEIELRSIAKFNPSFQVRIPCKSSPYLRSVLAYYSLFEITACLPITSMIPECSYFSLWSFSLPFLTKQTISFDFLSHEKEFFLLPKFRDLGFYYPPFPPSNNSHESQFTTGIPEAKIATLVLKSRWSGHVSLPTKIMPCGYLFDEFTIKASDLNSP